MGKFAKGKNYHSNVLRAWRKFFCYLICRILFAETWHIVIISTNVVHITWAFFFIENVKFSFKLFDKHNSRIKEGAYWFQKSDPFQWYSLFSQFQQKIWWLHNSLFKLRATLTEPLFLDGKRHTAHRPLQRIVPRCAKSKNSSRLI